MAKIHSADDSAAKGGDLGYLHRGMLAEGLHQQIDTMKAGEVSPAVDVLEGVALIKLHERNAAKLRDFDSVRPRALELLKREQADAAWKDFVARLRRDAVIEMGPSWTVTDIARGP
jgi:parvulin-like peptidyl-prolyl isomerase